MEPEPIDSYELIGVAHIGKKRSQTRFDDAQGPVRMRVSPLAGQEFESNDLLDHCRCERQKDAVEPRCLHNLMSVDFANDFQHASGGILVPRPTEMMNASQSMCREILLLPAGSKFDVILGGESHVDSEIP